MRATCLVLAVLVSALFSMPANAYTECQGSVRNIWVGDGGHVWIELVSGGSVNIYPNDPNREAALSLSTTALVSGHQIIIRYSADNVVCTSAGRTDFVGLYLI